MTQEQEQKAIAICRSAIKKDMAEREGCHTATFLDFLKGVVSKEELADYLEDVENGRMAVEFFENLLSSRAD